MSRAMRWQSRCLASLSASLGLYTGDYLAALRIWDGNRKGSLRVPRLGRFLRQACTVRNDLL